MFALEGRAVASVALQLVLDCRVHFHLNKNSTFGKHLLTHVSGLRICSVIMFALDGRIVAPVALQLVFDRVVHLLLLYSR